MIDRMIQTDDREEALGILQKRTEERTDQTYDLPKKRRQYKGKDDDSLSPEEAGIAIHAFSSGASEDGRSMAADGIMNNLGITLAENKNKVSAVMAELMKVRERLALVNKQLYIYDQES